MKKIPLTQGKFALVDDKDFENVNQYKWFAARVAHNKWYAARTEYPRASEFAALVMDAGIEQLFVTDNCSKS